MIRLERNEADDETRTGKRMPNEELCATLPRLRGRAWLARMNERPASASADSVKPAEQIEQMTIPGTDQRLTAKAWRRRLASTYVRGAHLKCAYD